MDEDFAIVNDCGLTIIGTIYRPKPRGKFPLVIIANDFFDNKESPHIKEAARLLLESNIAVVRFDFTNGYGESEGHGSDTTISQRAHDLEYVYEYCKRRAYINESKISIMGFGYGAMSSVVLEGFKHILKAQILINTPHDVHASTWTRFDDRKMMHVRLKRYFHVPLNGKEVRVNYTFFEDGEKIDMARCSRNLDTPTLFVYTDSPIFLQESTEWLSNRVPAKKEILHMSGLGNIDSRKGVKAIVDGSIKFLKKQKAA